MKVPWDRENPFGEAIRVIVYLSLSRFSLEEGLGRGTHQRAGCFYPWCDSPNGIMPLVMSFFLDPFQPTHVLTQNLRYRDASIRLLIVFKDGHERATDGQS